MNYRGVVYDVGLQFSPGPFSVDPFSPEQVKHDMKVISKELHANSVRIEGEEIQRLVVATEAAHEAGLKVLFNPWKMNADAEETIKYMAQAAVAAEKLRKKGVDLVFVAGCEYTIFSQGAFPGETFNDRVMFMVTNGGVPGHGPEKTRAMDDANKKLNEILAKICKGVRANFNGKITYSSGTWEEVNWDLFDIVGIDYYRRGETEEEYLRKLEQYRSDKPLLVMEVGSCAYEGAAVKGDGGFAVFQGVNPDGTIIYQDGIIPVRSEKEQADYVETQVNILSKSGIEGVFVYVFAFPIMPFSEEKGKDMDMTSYALVKTYPKHDPRFQKLPNWEYKEAFHRLADLYGKMAEAQN
ncbi:hypothetical protein DCM91_01005 [Chitinophaga costaii]|nr:hypothetical protein DCM91_01005 [Chitinophaga costaii]